MYIEIDKILVYYMQHPVLKLYECLINSWNIRSAIVRLVESQPIAR